MSYCRWSSDNFQCDLYCYEDQSGFVTHVAQKRYKTVSQVSLDDVLKAKPQDRERLLEYYNHWIERKEHVMEDIGLPYDGHSYHDPDLESFQARLLMLREAGYRVPDWVFEQVADEIKQDTE